ncbi:hypothetical protein BIW11_08996, partial [Tropilaelaps mercedesae]
MNKDSAARRNNVAYRPVDVIELFKPAPYVDVDETEASPFIESTMRTLKVLSYGLTFIIVLFSATTSRASLLLMTSQLDIPTGQGNMSVWYSLSCGNFNKTLPTRPVCVNSIQ